MPCLLESLNLYAYVILMAEQRREESGLLQGGESFGSLPFILSESGEILAVPYWVVSRYGSKYNAGDTLPG